MRRIIASIASIFFIATLNGQTSSDAIDFSQVMYQGTAKATGMASALGAVGGDQTSICINPAGMGLYRNSELNMSLGLLCNTSESSYYDNDKFANRFRLNIPNIGFVASTEKSNYSLIRFTQFGISLNRTNDYNILTNARGFNPNSSMIDDYLGQIDGYTPYDIEADFPYTIYPAWQTYLIDTISGQYTSPVPQGQLWQNQECNFKGRSEEWAFSFSANCMDRLFLGSSFGITHLKRFGTRSYKEEIPPHHQNANSREWTFNEELSSSGMGFNIKLGFIFHANARLRFGAAFHSPTLYAIDETWQTTTEHLSLQYNSKYLSPFSAYNYILITPLKWIGSVAIVGQRGLISMDAEYANYASSKFMDTENDPYDYTDKNKEISDLYGRTLNLRIGAEYMLRTSYVRAGVAYYGSPMGLGKKNGSIKKACIGLGIMADTDVFFDFAYELTHGVNEYYIYDYFDLKPVTQSQFRSNATVSLRIKF